MIHFSIYNVQLIGLLNCKLQVFLVINMIVVDVNRKTKKWQTMGAIFGDVISLNLKLIKH